jgi:hypothetical protein
MPPILTNGIIKAGGSILTNRKQSHQKSLEGIINYHFIKNGAVIRAALAST